MLVDPRHRIAVNMVRLDLSAFQEAVTIEGPMSEALARQEEPVEEGEVRSAT